MPSLVRGMVHMKMLHDFIEYDTAKAVIRVFSDEVFSVCVHEFLVPREKLLRYRNEPVPSCIGFTLCDTEDAATNFDIGFFDVDKLSDSASGVYQHQNDTRLRAVIDTAPEFIYLPHGKRLLFIFRLRAVNVEVTGIVVSGNVIPGSIFIKLREQAFHFLLCRVPAVLLADVIDDLVKIMQPDIRENHIMQP